MATKDTDAPKEQADKDIVEQQPHPEPQVAQTIVQPAVVGQSKAKKNQNVITIAIISGVVLFFVGLGLGYLLGHSTLDGDRDFRGGNLQLPGNGDGDRRFYPNSGTDDSTNNSGGSSSTTTPQMQTN